MADRANWDAIKREFVTTDATLRGLADRAGLSNSTVSDRARKENWKRLRADFRAQADENFLALAAENRARRLSRLADNSLDMLEAMLVRAAQQMADPTNPYPVNPKDVLEAISKIQLLRGDATERIEEKRLVGHVYPPELLAALGDLARRNLDGGRAPGADIRSLPGATERAS